MNWYVLYTSARAEKQVEQRLKLAGIETYLPLHRSRRKWSDRVKVVEVPLFNSYVFVRCEEHKLRELLLIYGVSGGFSILVSLLWLEMLRLTRLRSFCK